jgi:predicted lipoprotein with Yx(FWY)xxD motif
MHPKRSLAVIVTGGLIGTAVTGAIALTATGAAGAAPHPAARPAPHVAASTPKHVTVKTRHKDGLGTFLVTKDGTLYLFEKDGKDKSECSGECADDWPPLLSKDAPKAGHGVKASLLGTTKRSNGKQQVTYNDHPLYYFSGDQTPKQTRGEGVHEFGAEWFVVNKNGHKIDDDADHDRGDDHGHDHGDHDHGDH